MDVVVDASIIIAVVVNESSKPAIIQATQQADLVAPSSVHWEIGKNVQLRPFQPNDAESVQQQFVGWLRLDPDQSPADLS